MNNIIDIPIKVLNSEIPIPKFAYAGDAGFDLRSCVDITLKPFKRELIPCGFAIAIPEGYAGLIMPRSGLSLKHGVTVVNSPGLIDSGYRGEIKVILTNMDLNENFSISKGDKIAQMVIMPFLSASLVTSSELSASSRGNKGFGSSGV